MRRLVLSVVFISGLIVCPVVYATTRYVHSQYSTIQAAIDASSNGDIVIVLPGTYTGSGNQDIDFNGKAITVKSENGPENCIIDCHGTQANPHRGFYFHNGEGMDSIVDGFTIKNGYALMESTELGNRSIGGAILCINASSPVIMNNHISACKASNHGGGICCWGNSSPMIQKNSIIANEADTHGGGIFCYSSNPTITNCTITGNSAEGGGGISCVDASSTIKENTIEDNYAAKGGGIYSSAGATPNISKNIISSNNGYAWGGGIICYGTAKITSNSIIGNSTGACGGGVYCYRCTPEVTNNTIAMNEAGDGGGIGYWQCGSGGYGGSAIIANNVFIQNKADNEGGAIYCSETYLSVANNTIRANTAGSYGGGIDSMYYSHLNVINCILWDNSAPAGHQLAVDGRTYSTYLYVSYSNVEGGQPAVYIVGDGKLYWRSGNIDADPCLSADGYHLSSISPCINAGDPNGNYTAQTDIDGEPRVLYNRVDIGADEYSGTSLTGTVRDENTGSPIADAEVFVAGMSNLYDKSDANGHYEITGVPYDTFFNLVASAADYNTAYINDVQVTEANPIQTVDINLVPAPYTSLRLIELNPNPNSDPMVIMEGGIGHRYYQIVDEGNKPRSRISVTTDPNLGGPFFSSETICKGVVSIDVNSLEVTNGQTITVTHLRGIALTPSQQKSFVVHVEPLAQEKIWELQTAADLGVSNLMTEAEGAMEICLSDEQGSDSNPEVISVSRKALLGAGVTVSTKVGLDAQVAGFGASAGAGVEGSATAGGMIRDMFGYAYDTGDLTENVAKLDLLLYPATLLSPPLVLIQSGLEVTLLPSYREEFEAGVYIKGSGSAWGGLILGSPKSDLGVGLSGSADASVTSTGSFLWRKVGEYAIAVELGGDWRTQGGILIGGIPLIDSPATAFIPFWEPTGGLTSARFELCYDTNFVLRKIKIALSNGKESGIAAYDSTIDQIEWTITGPPQSLSAMLSPGGILDFLRTSLNAASPYIIDFSPSDIVSELDQVFTSIQRQGNLTVTYERKLITGRTIDAPVFDFDIGAALVIEADVGAGLEGSIAETRELTVQKGKVIGIRHYPTESYSENIYSPINITLVDVYQKALTDVGQPILQGIFDFVDYTVEAGQQVIINAANSTFQIGADVLQAGQQISTVFQVQPSQELMFDSLADTNMPLPSYFGIGGVFQLEPADLNLPSPATFAITYLDEEVAGHNESLLRMYRWSDANGRWEYIGGTVDDINNTVTASINKFGTYTIGAQVEYGNFTFLAEPNAAPSDGNSIVTFTSEVIKNNDGTSVADGVLFTLAASGGTITTADANNSLEGIQIVTNGGILQFILKAPQVGMKVKTEAVSLNRLAVVTGDVNFVDSNAPQPPAGLQAQIVEGKVLLSWNDNNEIDLAGYKIYFDDDTNGPPYNGVTYYSGSNSPIDVADANSHFLRGLRSGHTYYITVTAYDMSGNESGYDNEIVFVNTLPEDSDSDGMADSWEIAYSNVANGLDPTADDAMADNDGDGVTNLEEYLTGHNPLVPDVDGDFNHDRSVNILDLAVFCSHWLEQDCDDPNWCEGADINHSNAVNFVDFAFFAKNWSPQTPVALMPDFDYDGDVDFEDFVVLASQWLQPPGVPSADIAPTPADGLVNFLDYAVLADHWLQGTSP